MLESIFGPKTVRELKHVEHILKRDLSVLKKIFSYLDKNQSLCQGILNFTVHGKDVKNLFSSLLNVEHMIIVRAQQEHRIEIESVRLLEDLVHKTGDAEVQTETERFMALLKQEQEVLQAILELDSQLVKKGYTSIEKQVDEIRTLILRQVAIFKEHKVIIFRLLGKMSEEESAIKAILEKTYGRVVRKERAEFMERFLQLYEDNRLVECFILTKRIEALLDQITKKDKKEELIGLFRKMGVKASDFMIIFKVDAGRDTSGLVNAPPPQPQRAEGIIEQKLPGLTPIKITGIYQL